MSETNKYHLTLEDAESGMTLAHKTAGYVEVGLSKDGVEFSLPLAFLELFVKSVGGSISLPDTLHNTTASRTGSVIVQPQVTDKKIHFIKALRTASLADGVKMSLRDAKDLAEACIAGEEKVLYSGPIDKARAVADALREEGWMCVVESK